MNIAGSPTHREPGSPSAYRPGGRSWAPLAVLGAVLALLGAAPARTSADSVPADPAAPGITAVPAATAPSAGSTTEPSADGAAPQRPPGVVVVANSLDPDSLELARYYLERRGLPARQLLALPLPTAETISWAQFSAEIFNPLRARLIAEGWLNAFPERQPDSAGRLPHRILGHEIEYLVLMRGVPLRIAHDPALDTPEQAQAVREIVQVMLGVRDPAQLDPAVANFKKNEASVDAELALLALSGSVPNAGFIPNPLFDKQRPFHLDQQRVVRVCRLDGPTPASVRSLVDSALAGESRGLLGRAYFDRDGRQEAGYERGNRWLSSAERIARDLGFETVADDAPATFPATLRADAPALYFGWWSWNVDGPFGLPGYRFPPGAVAVHLHSFSAETLRRDGSQPESRWAGPLVARGAAATLGNVHEPYLQFTHFLDLFLAALAQGRTFGEAAYQALPVLSWQAVAIGDPLYRPFRVPLPDQLGRLGDPDDPTHLRQYAALRRLRLLEAENRSEEALGYARSAFARAPGLALGLDLARRQAAAGDPASARRTLGLFRTLPLLAADEWMLGRAAADFLYRELRDTRAALGLYLLLLNDPALPADLARELLPEAILVAASANEPRLAQRWGDRLRELPPAPAPPAPAP